MEQTRSGPLDLHAIAATTLGHVESDRFAEDADRAHLDAAETAYRAALAVTDCRSPRWVVRTSHLAMVGVERWRLDGDIGKLTGAVVLLEAALAGTEGSGSQLMAMTNLAVALRELFEATGDVRHLDRGLALLDAVEAVDPGREAWNRTVLLRRRNEVVGDGADLHLAQAAEPRDSSSKDALRHRHCSAM